MSIQTTERAQQKQRKRTRLAKIHEEEAESSWWKRIPWSWAWAHETWEHIGHRRCCKTFFDVCRRYQHKMRSVHCSYDRRLGIRRSNFTKQNNKVDVWPWLCFYYLFLFLGLSLSLSFRFAFGSHRLPWIGWVSASASRIRARLMNLIAPFSIVILTETNL